MVLPLALPAPHAGAASASSSPALFTVPAKRLTAPPGGSRRGSSSSSPPSSGGGSPVFTSPDGVNPLAEAPQQVLAVPELGTASRRRLKDADADSIEGGRGGQGRLRRRPSFMSTTRSSAAK
jgi:hypothetical protein